MSAGSRCHSECLSSSRSSCRKSTWHWIMRPRSAVMPHTQRMRVSCRLAGDACSRGGDAGARRPFTCGYLKACLRCITICVGYGKAGVLHSAGDPTQAPHANDKVMASVPHRRQQIPVSGLHVLL